MVTFTLLEQCNGWAEEIDPVRGRSTAPTSTDPQGEDLFRVRGPSRGLNASSPHRRPGPMAYVNFPRESTDARAPQAVRDRSLSIMGYHVHRQ